MRLRALLGSSVLTGVSCLAFSAIADDSGFDMGAPAPAAEAPPATAVLRGTVEAGVQDQTARSFFFGRYSGADDKGLTAVGTMDLHYRAPWDSGDTGYGDVTATDLGLTSRAIVARYGQQGQWDATAFATQIPHEETDSAATPFLGANGTRLTLPGNWVAGFSTADMTALTQDLRRLDIRTDREKVGGNVALHLADDIVVRIETATESKTGTKPEYLSFGSSYGSAQASFFPQRIDYQTDDLSLSVSSNRPRLQWSLAYRLSRFTDHAPFTVVDNPFSGFEPNSGYPTAMAAYGAPPSNSAHTLSLTGGYNVSPATRLTAHFSWGLELQNAPFSGYTANPQLVVSTALPRSSFDGEAQTRYGNLTLTSHLAKDWDLRASYTYDQYDNMSPSNLYTYIIGDAQNQPTGNALNFFPNARYNLPYSYTKDGATANVGYRLFGGTKLSFGVSDNVTDRDYLEVSHESEYTARTSLISSFDDVTTNLSYSFARRLGSDYIANAPWLAGNTTAFLTATPTNLYLEDPALQKFYMANRDRQKLSATLTVTPTAETSVGVHGSIADDDYSHSTVGLTKGYAWSVGMDGNYQVGDGLDIHLFYDYENIVSGQNGYSFIDTSGNPDDDWSATTRNRIHTAGLGADWTVIDDVLKIGATYSLSASGTDIAVATSPLNPVTAFAPPTPFPTVTALSHNVGAHANITIMPNAMLKFAYTFERYHSDDWKYTGLQQNTLPDVLASGESSPNYSVQVFGTSFVYRF